MLGIFSCTDVGEPVMVPQESASAENSKYRSDAELIDIAVQGYELVHDKALDYSNSRGLNSVSITPIVSHNSRGVSDTLIQVVNYGEGKGFALIGALKSSDYLLAVIESGDYAPGETDQVEGFDNFIQRAQARISARPNIGDSIPYKNFETKVERKYGKIYTYGPHIAVQWNQHEYAGAYCPNGLSGCVPLSATMALTYLEVPSSMTLTFPERDVNSINLDWQGMRSHFKNHSEIWPDEWYGITLPDAEDCPAGDYNHSNIGRVTRQIGYAIKANYAPGATSSFNQKAVNYLKTLIPNLRVSTYYSPSANLINGLKNGVALTEGASLDPAGPTPSGLIELVGHSWLTDGVMETYMIEDTYRNYRPEVLEGDWRLIKSEFIKLNDYLHFNWGAGGKYNGYFLKRCYDPNEAYENDPGFSNPETDYNFENDVVFRLISLQ